MAKRFLNLNEITAEAMSIIPGATTEEKNIAQTWAYRALRQLGPSKDHIEVCTLYPEDLVMTKPSDFHSAIDIALFDSTGRELAHNYRSGKKRIHEDLELSGVITISEDDEFFHLSSNSTNVAYAVLRYFRFPVDQDGYPLFPEYTAIAISLFIRYMWALRTGDRSFKAHEESWKVVRMEARGQNKMPSGMMYKQFAKEWMSMIPNNNFYRF